MKFNRRKRPFRLIIIAIFLSPVIIISLFLIYHYLTLELKKAGFNKTKIILIGLDGATWKIMRPLIRQGRLPNISKLIDEGAQGVLLSEAPLFSSVLFTSIATGKKKEKHGIINLVVKKSDVYSFTCYNSLNRKTKAFWNILTDYGDSVGVVNWWATYPAEKINGFIVSDYFSLPGYALRTIAEKNLQKSNLNSLIYPKSLSKIILKYQKIAISPKEFLYPKYKQASLPELWSFIHQTKEEGIDFSELRKKSLVFQVRNFSKIDTQVFLIGKYLLKQIPVDLFSIYLQGLDIMQHVSWHFQEPDVVSNRIFNPTTEEMKLFGQIIPKYYEWYDHLIGELLKEIHKQNTTIIIVSDHGFQSNYNQFPYLVNLNLLFETLGWLKFENDEICWPKTFVYQPIGIPTLGERAICLNLYGREPNGVIRAEEYEEWRGKIRDKLLSLETQDGKRIFNEIRLINNPKDKNLDLEVKINLSLSPDDKLLINNDSNLLKKFIIPFIHSGDHSLEGVIIMSGKHIKKGKEIKGATIFDITPTILALLGIPIGKDMDGKVLVDAIKEDCFLKNPLSYIGSHDYGLIQRKKFTIDSYFDEKMKDRLKNIGYLQ